ncbi:ABC transporter ATP-binding protein [bacterium]|nr:MAG: ABC transporter ATP-binding protein [bacterium]
MPELETRHLVKRFGGMQAISDCNLRIAGGSITGLIGPNGAGKSTVFSMISGFLRSDGGEIWFKGRRIDGLPAHRVARLGIIRTFQTPHELRELSVLENLMVVPRSQFGESLAGLLPFGGRRVRKEEHEIEERAIAVLRTVGLEHHAQHRAADLSGGQKKLLEIARCMMCNPKVALLDEPTAGVNPSLINDLMEVIRVLHNGGVTVVIIEHNMNVVMRLCGHVVVLDRGAVMCEGTPDSIQRDERVLAAYLGSPP